MRLSSPAEVLRPADSVGGPHPQAIPFAIAVPIQLRQLRSRLPSAGASDEALLVALARTMLAGPGWDGIEESTIVVRMDPVPGLTIVGRGQAAAVDLAGRCATNMARAVDRLRYFDWQAIERLVETLADRLLDQAGREQLQRARFLSIPRGGHIVHSLLLYQLDIPDPTFGTEVDSLTVIIDDCALSGLRFDQFHESHGGRNTIFAHLASCPEARAAIEKRRPGVRCVAAVDLSDTAPAEYGNQHQEWRDRWRDRVGPDTPWIGLPEHVCFPWNEPDITVWDDAGDREQQLWRIVPPELCAKNRGIRRATPRSVQEISASSAPGIPDSVVFARFPGRIIVANLDRGECLALNGVAASFWLAAAAGLSDQAAEPSLLDEYDVDRSRLRRDFADFRRQLTRSEFLRADVRNEARPGLGDAA